MRHDIQGFQQPVFTYAYNEKKHEFWKTESFNHKSAIASDVNMISSHKIYKIKFNDDNTLKLKAWISPQTMGIH